MLPGDPTTMRLGDREGLVDVAALKHCGVLLPAAALTSVRTAPFEVPGGAGR
jgi:hypothetical protein